MAVLSRSPEEGGPVSYADMGKVWEFLITKKGIENAKLVDQQEAAWKILRLIKDKVAKKWDSYLEFSEEELGIFLREQCSAEWKKESTFSKGRCHFNKCVAFACRELGYTVTARLNRRSRDGAVRLRLEWDRFPPDNSTQLTDSRENVEVQSKRVDGNKTQGLRRKKDAQMKRPSIDQIHSQIQSAYKSDRNLHDLSTAQLPDAWIDLLRCFNRSFYATNFIRNDEIFKKNYAQLGLAIQADQMKLGKHIIKILIIKAKEEYEKLREQMMLQFNARLDVRWIRYKTICDDTNLAEPWNKVDRYIDFQIYDSEVVLVWVLNEDSQRIESGKIFVSRKKIDQFKDFYVALLREAHYFDPNEPTPGFE